MNYTLYKEPVSLDTLYIVQYLHSIGQDFRPRTIVERNRPSEITELPSIRYGTEIYLGLDQVVNFYEEHSNVSNLLAKARAFKNQNPDYTINKL